MSCIQRTTHQNSTDRLRFIISHIVVANDADSSDCGGGGGRMLYACACMLRFFSIVWYCVAHVRLIFRQIISTSITYTFDAEYNNNKWNHMNAFAPPTVASVIGVRFPYFLQAFNVKSCEKKTWIRWLKQILHDILYSSFLFTSQISTQREDCTKVLKPDSQQHTNNNITYSTSFKWIEWKYYGKTQTRGHRESKRDGRAKEKKNS